MQTEVTPIMFDGKEINTIHDLINNFKLDTYEEAAEKRKHQVEDPDMPLPTKNDIDENFWDMIQNYRPIGAYYEHSHGDKLLYMKKVDKINYDVVGAYRERREKQLEEELKKLKEEKEANK